MIDCARIFGVFLLFGAVSLIETLAYCEGESFWIERQAHFDAVPTQAIHPSLEEEPSHPNSTWESNDPVTSSFPGPDAFPGGEMLERHVGRGTPLEGTSWRNRPLYVGWHVGGLWGDTLIKGRVDQEEDLFGGYQLGWDFDHYWGTEFRLGFSYLDVIDAGEPVSTRTSGVQFYDVSLLYYPWGDAAWRPYAGIGMGLAHLQFRDENDLDYNETLFQMPLSLGVKYYFRNWLALRLTAADNLAFGSGSVETLHQWSLTGGVEVRFGGRPTSYFPWSPSIHSW